MVQFLSILFFSWISSIFVGFFKSSLFCVILYIGIGTGGKVKMFKSGVSFSGTEFLRRWMTIHHFRRKIYGSMCYHDKCSCK